MSSAFASSHDPTQSVAALQWSTPEGLEDPSATEKPFTRNIHPAIQPYKEELIKLRRHFHQYPELGFQEEKTCQYIADYLRKIEGIEVFDHVGRTGVIGLIKGTKQTQGKVKCVGFRADMDGLPIQEVVTERNKEYVSKHPGVHHACGHDGHMSQLMVAAVALSKMRDQFSGTIKLIFQPAEEGFGGAREIIKDGVLEDGKFGPRVDEIYGIHIWTYLPCGTVGLKAGALMAASDRFTITVTGSGGHGAVPDVSKDALIAGANLVGMLQTIVSRNISPLDSAVLTIGQINAGAGYNIIADKCTLTGTVRTFYQEVQHTIKTRMQEMCDGLSRSFNVQATLDYHHAYPCTSNRAPVCLNAVQRVSEAIVGTGGIRAQKSTMCAEDMSYYLNVRPGAFWFLGASPDAKVTDQEGQNTNYPHHKSSFDLHEDCLEIGASQWVLLALDRLGD